MVKSYFIKPKSWSDDYEYQYHYSSGSASNIEVSEKDLEEPIFSGLLDKDGYPLFYMERRNPIGFIHFDD